MENFKKTQLVFNSNASCALIQIPSSLSIEEIFEFKSNLKEKIRTTAMQRTRIYLYNEDGLFCYFAGEKLYILEFKSDRKLSNLLHEFEFMIEANLSNFKFVSLLTEIQENKINTYVQPRKDNFKDYYLNASKLIKVYQEKQEIEIKKLHEASKKKNEISDEIYLKTKINYDCVLQKRKIKTNISKIEQRITELTKEEEFYKLCIEENTITTGPFSATYKNNFPIHQAVHEDNADELKYLLSNPSITDQRDDDGYTPLHYASEYGNEVIITLLLKEGANYNLPNPFGKTAINVDNSPTQAVISFALKQKTEEIMKLISKYTEKGNPQALQNCTFAIKEFQGFLLMQGISSKPILDILDLVQPLEFLAQSIIKITGVNPPRKLANNTNSDSLKLTLFAPSRSIAAELLELMNKYIKSKTLENLQAIENYLDSIEDNNSINDTFDSGNTIGHLAMQEQLFDVVCKLIVETKYDFFAKNNHGQTILDIANNLNINHQISDENAKTLKEIIEFLNDQYQKVSNKNKYSN